MKPNIRQLKRWIAALDSGEYKQGKRTLQFKNQYCCLGVGCDLLIPKYEQRLDDANELYGILPHEQPNAPKWLKEIDWNFASKTGFNLSELNDKGFHLPRNSHPAGTGLYT